MTLEEIFIKNPELLENEEVKKLIKYVGDKHKLLAEIAKKDSDKLDRILEICIYSEAFFIKGESCKEAIYKIANLA